MLSKARSFSFTESLRAVASLRAVSNNTEVMSCSDGRHAVGTFTERTNGYLPTEVQVHHDSECKYKE